MVVMIGDEQLHNIITLIIDHAKQLQDLVWISYLPPSEHTRTVVEELGGSQYIPGFGDRIIIRNVMISLPYDHRF